MTTIQLNRRFHEWREGAIDAPSYRWGLAFSGDLLTWNDLDARRRVVILAEAGSGKTVELVHRAQQLSAEGKFAFYTTVQDVAREGLDGALRAVERPRLDAWRRGEKPAWFFIDSVDDAKLDGIRLDKALRQLANGIVGHEGRAFIVLSGRHTDWEFARDAWRLQHELPIPPDEPREPPPSARTLIRRALHFEKRPDPTPQERPLIALMAPLDDKQVHLYVNGKGVGETHAFLGALRSGNLQEIARRPLDLDWLVLYWQANGHFGRFEAMVGASLRERLREPDPDRSRPDELSVERALSGLERIGAALVFGRKATVAIPDADASPPSDRDVLTIDAVLPDWRSSERHLLLSRPAFDPATFGRARLHNDNEGVVRGYLAARWLLRLRKTNLSARQLHDLLFAQSYGIDLVRPSVLETAAWLSLWDESVAREVIRRAPFLLFTAGDPSSLPVSTRAAVLQAFVAQIREGEEVPILDMSSLTRFAQADIVPVLRNLWGSDAQDAKIRSLLLRLVWLGALRDCADLAANAACGQFPDRSTLLTAGRALIAAGDYEQRRNYADYVKRNGATLPSAVVWDAVKSLFPKELGVDDLLEIYAVVNLQDKNWGGFNIEWEGASLVEGLSDAAGLARLIRGLMEAGGGELSQDEGKDSDKRRAVGPLLAVAAERLLGFACTPTELEAAIDSVLYLADRRVHRMGRHDGKTKDAIARLHETADRRRAAFWRAAERLSTSNVLGSKFLQTTWQMEFLGWPPGLRLDDVDWLLADGPSRSSLDEQRLAANAALEQWDRAGRPKEVMTRIEAAATGSAAMRAAISDWLHPPEESAELRRGEAELRDVQAKGKKQRADAEQSWVDFVESLRNDPEPLRDIRAPTESSVDPRLHNLWLLLREANRGGSRYAIDSVAPLAELAGSKAAAAFTSGMAQMWRAWRPTLQSARPFKERNLTATFDCLGIAAISIEAAKDPAWATKLTEEQAIRAAEYATLELNGFPSWLEALAERWPVAVQRVLAAEAASDLDNPEPNARYPILYFIDGAGEKIVDLLAGPIWQELQSRKELRPTPLGHILSIVRKGLAQDQQRQAYELAIERFRTVPDPQTAALYLGLACAIDGRGAVDALFAKLEVLSEAEKTAQVQWVLPQIFGSRFSLTPGGGVDLDLPTLERLVILAYRTVRVGDDRDRSNGRAFSPDERDDAQEARSSAFERLVQTPGRAAFDAILRFLDVPDFPVTASRLRALAHQRAATDSELTAWAGEEVFQFEQRAERAPKTTQELKLLAIQRLEDLQHDLIHGDFSQGATLSGLPDEPAVQVWMADRMRRSQGASYSIEREPEIVDEKQPDMVFTARATAARLPTEIKVAESCSVTELEGALVKQLCGQYLRADDSREGLLILVHQKPRAKGWKLQSGEYLQFAELVQRLRELAASIRRGSPDGPQPEIVVIDVSSCASPRSTRHCRTR